MLRLLQKLANTMLKSLKLHLVDVVMDMFYFLEEEKFKVKQTDMRSLHAIKIKHNIPLEMQSCHTTILGKYFIEGHVPIEAINKLLKEQPDIDGIALPGMPIGTPGMPGEKEEPYIIYQLVDGKSSVFMTI